MRLVPTGRAAVATAGAALALVVAGCSATPGPSAGPPAGTTSDQEAAQAFFDAVVAGDRAAAADVATPGALLVFEPWAPVDGQSVSSVQHGTFVIHLTTTWFECSVTGGIVDGCSGASFDDPPSDEEAARAFVDAVLAGDRDAATALAGPDAVEAFEPWEPAPGLTLSEVSDGTFVVDRGAASTRCVVSFGVVVRCEEAGAAP